MSSRESSQSFSRSLEKSYPELIGPGNWAWTHTLAKNAQTDEGKKIFVNHMELMRQLYPCEVCRPHIDEYIRNNPMRHFWNVRHDRTGQEIGMFKWSWMFHNAVNRRLGKEIMDFEKAYNMFYESDHICYGCSSRSEVSRVSFDGPVFTPFRLVGR